MTNGTRSVSNLKMCFKKKHNCDAGYHAGRRNAITLFMMSLYKDGCLYGGKNIAWQFIAWKLCMEVLHGKMFKE